MSNPLALEICVESVDHAVAAELGGAHRIELCSDMSSGGITPSAGLMQTARRHVRLPIHVLIRPRMGDFCYSDHEFETMRNDIQAALQLHMDGVVLGVLHKSGRVDIERTKTLVESARPLPVTFHRAFDVAENLETALEEVIQTGASRILTSGGEPHATDALSTLARLVQSAGNRIALMPCGSINSENFVRIVRATLAREFHTSVGTSQSSGDTKKHRASHNNHNSDSTLQFKQFERKVAELVGMLASISDRVS